MRPPAIRDAQSFRAYGEAVERLCAPGVLAHDQLDRLAETRAVSVGEHRVRGLHLPGERLVIVHEGGGLGVWLHELAHAALDHRDGSTGDEVAACELAERLGGHGPGTDASTVAVNGEPDYFRFAREGDPVCLRVLHEKCGRECASWFPVMPGREAHVLALCDPCSMTALVPLTARCCETEAAFRWTADASPASPRIEQTCDTCGAREVLLLARRESSEPPAPETIYKARARDALAQTARRLHAMTAGELDPSLFGGFGHVLMTARHLDDNDRMRVESVVLGVRRLIDGGELREAAEVLEGAARTLAD